MFDDESHLLCRLLYFGSRFANTVVLDLTAYDGPVISGYILFTCKFKIIYSMLLTAPANDIPNSLFDWH